MKYNNNMDLKPFEFIETPYFTKLITEVMSDELYKELQKFLLIKPDAGDLIQGSGGIRKLRWEGSGRGKRGSTRVIYYWYMSKEKIYMLLVYKKNDQDNLTSSQVKILHDLIKELTNGE